MAILKEMIKKNIFILGIRLLFELWFEFNQIFKYIGTTNTWKTKGKIQAFLTIETHAVEKGLSLRDPRPGFGEKRIIRLLDDLRKYMMKFNDSSFLNIPLNVIKEYIAYQKSIGINNSEIENKCNKMMDDYRISLNIKMGGIKLLKRADINCDFEFKKFAESRFSIRDFSDEPVLNEKIIQALEIAKKTPSACNRQPCHLHIFTSSEIKNKLLNFQNGNRGYSEKIDKVVLVTSDLNSFLLHEIHQGYVDGGLFAMSFIYALHSLGIASIPLTTSFPFYRKKKLYGEFSIPMNQIPILMIGIGNYPAEFKVAISERKTTESFYSIY